MTSFQQGVGKFGADSGVIAAVFGGAIMIIIGVVLLVLSFIPMRQSKLRQRDSCTQDKDCRLGQFCRDSLCACSNDANCSNGGTCDPSGACSDPDGGGKKRVWWLSLVGLVLIALAIFGMWYSVWYKKEVYKNKAVAELGAVSVEAGVAAGVIGSIKNAL